MVSVELEIHGAAGVHPVEAKTLHGESTEQIIPNENSFSLRYGGICMAILASLFFTSTMLIIKVLGQSYDYPGTGTAVLFNVGVLTPCVPAMLQGSLQGISVLLRSESLLYIPIGDMTVIVFSSPVIVAVLAHFILKEKCALFPILLAMLTLGGIFLIMKPPLLTGRSSFDSKTLMGSLFALGALLSLSLKFVVTRSIKEVPVLTMTGFLGTCGLAISLPLFLSMESFNSILPKTLPEFFLVFGLLLAFGSIASINSALKMELATNVALVRSLDVIFAFLFQFVFLGVIPDSLSIIGATLVVFAVLVTAFRKWVQELKPEHKLRTKLAFLLL